MKTRTRVLAYVLAGGALSLWLGASQGVVAQGIPPFPVLYGGSALLDGVPLPAGTTITARVGNYEASTAVEENGEYRNLLVAPPSQEYFFQPVTFHALGLEAEEKDLFAPSQQPTFKDQGFDLHFTRSAATPTPTATATPAAASSGPVVKGGTVLRFALGGAAILVVLGAWLWLQKVWK